MDTSAGRGGAGGRGGGDGGAGDIDPPGPGPGDGGSAPGDTSPSTGVPQTCADAEARKSYIGCEYWPTVTVNLALEVDFEFAVVATNPTMAPADVTVTLDGSTLAEVTVEPGDLETIRLPWVDELLTARESVLVPGGGFKVTSTVPITLYQFNPLDFQLDVPECDDCPECDFCYSYTNDASLVLPKTALGTDYYVMSYPTHHVRFGTSGWDDSYGFVAITATEDGTEISVTASGYVREGTDVAPLGPGDQGYYTLDAGDVLMLQSDALPARETPQPGKPCSDEYAQRTLCPTGPQYDLTGTRIQTNKPVSVIGGHDCTFVPYTAYACDHLEEAVFPVEALGKDLILTAPSPVALFGTSAPEPDNMVVRVLSAANDNTITFDPPVAEDVTLKAGEWVELGPFAQDVVIKADDKILVGQYMVGADYNSDGGANDEGDPSFSIGIPTEQYRVDYTFLAPATYTHNFVNVTAPTGAVVKLDGATIPANEFRPIGSSDMSVARLSIRGGTHVIKSDVNFGISVYGYGDYTSYMYPGGLDLEAIVIIPD